MSDTNKLRALEDAILALDRIGDAVTCTYCGRRKNPRGRDSGAQVSAGLCHASECEGYDRKPYAMELHPGERASDFGYGYMTHEGSMKVWAIIRRIREERESEEEDR